METETDSEYKPEKHHIKDAPWDTNAWEVVGHFELTEEQKKLAESFPDILKQFGVDIEN